MKNFSIAVALTAALGVSTAAFAAPDPTDPRAGIPTLQYRSPFRDYRPLGEDKPLAWKAANDEVQRIGGWRAYAKESRETPATDVAPTASPATPVKPMAEPPAKGQPGHAGHGQPKEEQKK